MTSALKINTAEKLPCSPGIERYVNITCISKEELEIYSKTRGDAVFGLHCSWRTDLNVEKSIVFRMKSSQISSWIPY
ncbi:Ets Translocation Variant 3 [Manis pentadactyla]|nr:Ets Translocation Variant 3 [Manis pentadactyla]